MVAALLLTTPRPVPKSSSDDLAPTHHSQKIRIQSRGRAVSATPRMLHIEQASSPEYHNPTDGSFAPLVTRPSTCTKCPNLRFLSY
ncbi:hypothetical protein CEXT_427371 [Caerostris extrusa]|uniref:Uncharacterized protein n=1 Tax=Caerostris extrusa TaxID=172846 RepID=A0AAV4XF48_CAEEX|nr:hypothetical protein CEXT_779751 [Caerostris extrusa]GIY54506.1 hypothetical protein CEXT_675261 [Caerostris extrusa]GIY93268.1 hypothetical protein CEXT_427371 [Caerostris extrusa]